jgi:transmembrane sensor
MTPDRSLINRIIARSLLKGQLTDDEKALLQEWLKEESNLNFYEQIKLEEGRLQELAIFSSFSEEEGLKNFLAKSAKLNVFTIAKKSYWQRYVAAASVFFLLGTGVYLMMKWKNNEQKQATVNNEQRITNDVKPGEFKAKLTLADGRTIILDSTTSGELAKQGKTVVLNRNGQLVYTSDTATTKEVLYNTLSTAKGESYVTTLSDGSKIFLNAGSSITYPVSFVGSERKVTIKGEGFFEVAKNISQTFSVSILSSSGADKGHVTVTGTHFNVSAYDDEMAVRTTLEEGTVIYQKDEKKVTLTPGQQAILTENNVKVVNNVNVTKITAWKNGEFFFLDDDIKTIMRQLARWYDLDVVYEGKIPTGNFDGMIDRSTNLSEVLKMLEVAGIRFKLEKHKITVLN